MKESKQRALFDEWIDQYRALLFKVIRAYARHQADEDDLFQEICLQLFRSIPNFKGLSAVSTWIYRIALNTAIQWSTRARKHVEGHQTLDPRLTILEEKDAILDDKIQWLYHQIHQLDEVDKSITLLLLEGYSYKEMAEILGITESNLGVKIHRIKKQLVSHAKRYDYGN